MVNGMRRYPVGTDLMFPLNNDTVPLIMEYNKEIYNRSLIPADWNSDLEVIKYSKFFKKQEDLSVEGQMPAFQNK